MSHVHCPVSPRHVWHLRHTSRSFFWWSRHSVIGIINYSPIQSPPNTEDDREPFIAWKRVSIDILIGKYFRLFYLWEDRGRVHKVREYKKNWKIEECTENLTKSHVWVRYNGNVIMVVFIKILCSLKWCRAQVKTIHIILYDHESAVISNLDVINICNTWLNHSPLLPPHPPANNFIVFWFYLWTTGLAHLRLKIFNKIQYEWTIPFNANIQYNG